MPDHDLNARIGAKMGLKNIVSRKVIGLVGYQPTYLNSGIERCLVPDFSHDIAAAFSVVERLRAAGFFWRGKWSSEQMSFIFNLHNDWEYYGDTTELPLT